MLLAAGLWRAGTVTRWIPAGLATIVVTFLAPTSGLWAIPVEVPMALASLGIALHTWRLADGTERAPAGAAGAPVA